MYKKIFVCFLTLVLALSLAACGNKSSVEKAEISTEKYEDYHGEGEVQGGIKSDEEIAALTAEAEQGNDDAWDGAEDKTESEINVEMTGHEPDSTGNFQDYWEGDSYFDLVKYLEDNEYSMIMPLESIGAREPLPEGKTARFYTCYDKDSKWTLGIGIGDIQVCQHDYSHMYMVNINNDELITIDKTGMQIPMSEVVAIDTIVQVVKAHVDEDDPLQYTSLTYDIMH